MPEPTRVREGPQPADAGPARAPKAGILPLSGTNLRLARRGRQLLDVAQVRFDGDGVSALMGANGAGKSLLARVLADLVAPDSGEVLWGGLPPRRRRRTALGMVFQKPVLLRRSAIANVRHALHAAGVARRHSAGRAARALTRAGLASLARSPARLLSGGEQQRLAIARALALDPEVLILDEPTANLDPAATARIETLIRESAAQGYKVVLITHDIGQARRLATDVTFLHTGRIVDGGPAESFFEAPASEAARAFLAGRLFI